MLVGLGFTKKSSVEKIEPERSLEYAIENGVEVNNLPKHIAFIMDGNGRWAKSKGEKRNFGHNKDTTFYLLKSNIYNTVKNVLWKISINSVDRTVGKC